MSAKPLKKKWRCSCSTAATSVRTARLKEALISCEITWGECTRCITVICVQTIWESTPTNVKCIHVQTWQGIADKGTQMTSHTRGTHCVNSVTSVSWTTMSCTNTCAKTTFGVTSVSAMEVSSITQITCTWEDISVRSTFFVKRTTVSTNSLPLCSAARWIFRPTELSNMQTNWAKPKLGRHASWMWILHLPLAHSRTGGWFPAEILWKLDLMRNGMGSIEAGQGKTGDKAGL